MQVCPHCGRQSRAIDRFCLHCGQRLDGPSSGGDPMPVYVAVAEKNGASPRPAPPDRPIAGGRASPPVMPTHLPILGRLVLQPRAGINEGVREFTLDGSEIQIGRAPSCQIALPTDQLVSRQHAQLQYQNGKYTIKDLGSSNGTHVNGIEIHDATVLNEGDRIKIGEHELVYTRTPSRNTDGFPIPVPPAWPPAVSGETTRQPSVSANRPVSFAPSPDAASVESPSTTTDPLSARATTESELASAAPTSPPSSPPASAASIPLAFPDAALGSVAYTEQLRAQLVEASAGLARRVEEAEREVAELRGALAEIEQHLASVLASLHPAAPEESAAEGDADASSEPASADASSAEAAHTALLDELIAVTRVAADNPRHLDYVTALAARAGDLARVLQTERVAIASLEDVRARLAKLAG